ncbi:hypothetical protein BDY24DRAFT_415686 [Mrakia frigida]|uniref:uncharacterized protein n=1 Tax=Mrakia frigida TaxID=29902 RepID=UPI003FCC1240
MLRTTTTTAARTLLRSSSRLQQRSYQVDRSTFVERNQGPLLIAAAVLSLASIYVLQPQESWASLGPTPTKPSTPAVGSAQDVMGSQTKTTPPPK